MRYDLALRCFYIPEVGHKVWGRLTGRGGKGCEGIEEGWCVLIYHLPTAAFYQADCYEREYLARV